MIGHSFDYLICLDNNYIINFILINIIYLIQSRPTRRELGIAIAVSIPKPMPEKCGLRYVSDH